MRQILLILSLVLFFSCASDSNKTEKKPLTQDSSTISPPSTDTDVEVENEGLIIEGQLESVNSGTVFLEANQQGKNVKVASSEIDDSGGFKIQSDAIQKNYAYKLVLPNAEELFLYLDANEIHVNEVAGNLVISGSEESKYYNDYMQIIMNYNADLSELNKSYQHYANTGNTKEAQKVSEEFSKINTQRLNALKTLLSNMPASMTLMNGLLEFLDDADNHSAFLKSSLEKIKASSADVPNKEEFVKHIESKLVLSKGNVAPNFTLPTPAGGTISLSSLRGKYVLIDFWASWCSPCRAENPNVVKVYEKYKKDGFEILGVSLDKDKERWLNAIEKDGLVWKHGSDLKFWQSDVAQLYGVTGIPFTVLVDKSGVIIEKNLRGAALEEKLKTIFKH